jgi:ABC-2 type transport system ATP-binding protein
MGFVGVAPDEGAKESGAIDFLYEAETPEVLNSALDQARQTGALLIELAREMRDLEDVLTEALQEQRNDKKGAA